MKFTCDSCDAAYMISDEKVGPNGVKVRCKKCGNVITVTRAEESAAPPRRRRRPRRPPPPAASRPGGALDDRAGPAPSTTPSAPGRRRAAGAGPEAPDLDAGPGRHAPRRRPACAARSAPPAPAATEWYVAIGEAQVGPLPLAEVRQEVGGGRHRPRHLVWRPGMADWGPLSAVAELAAYLSPVPRGSARRPAAARAGPGAGRHPAPSARRHAPPPAPADVAWKPSGASALAALASEEIDRPGRPRPRPPPRPAASARSLMEQLPDAGGVDPTGAIPLSIKGLERRPTRGRWTAAPRWLAAPRSSASGAAAAPW